VDVVGGYAHAAKLNLFVHGTTTPVLNGQLTISEAGTTNATYDLALNTQPAATVTVSLSMPAGHCVNTVTAVHNYGMACSTNSDCGSGYTCETPSTGTVSPSSVVFTPSNWSVAVPITVTAVADPFFEPAPAFAVVSHTASSADPLYDTVGMCVKYATNGACLRNIGLPASGLTVNITGNNNLGVSFSSLSVNITEAAAGATLSASLLSQPLGIVTASFKYDTAQLSVSPSAWCSPRLTTPRPSVSPSPH